MSKRSANCTEELNEARRGNDIWHDVALLAWPSAEQSRAALRDAGRPRLLLVPVGCDPPIMEDEFEDWVHTPADPRDVQARVETLLTRATRDVRPHLDEEGRLHASGRWVALSPIECRLVRTLLDHFGTVAAKELLLQSGWPSGASSRRLNMQMNRLRRRLETMGITVRTIHAKGYALDRV